MDLDAYTVDEIRRGFSQQGETWQCLCCGKLFCTGEIYAVDGRFFEAARAVEIHLEHSHPDYREELIESDTKYNSLTGNQRQLLKLFAQGLPDKEIAAVLGVTPSTVRHQKFQFREKAKQARHYLAVYESALAGAKGGSAIVPIHEHARMVDQRYVITENEREHILQTAFVSLHPLRLGQFSPREKKKLVILARIAQEFEQGRHYTEPEVNAVLQPIFDDFSTIRRYLIEYGFMQRSRDGSDYRLTERA